jgi:hypothetical protein
MHTNVKSKISLYIAIYLFAVLLFVVGIHTPSALLVIMSLVFAIPVTISILIDFVIWLKSKCR